MCGVRCLLRLRMLFITWFSWDLNYSFYDILNSAFLFWLYSTPSLLSIRFDLRQFLYNTKWTRQFRSIDELVKTDSLEKDKRSQNSWNCLNKKNLYPLSGQNQSISHILISLNQYVSCVFRCGSWNIDQLNQKTKLKKTFLKVKMFSVYFKEN